MEPKQWSEWKMRHGFYNVSEPYQIYKKRYSGLFRPEPGANQKIVLFGDGYVFDTYFKRYKNRYRPSGIVLVTEEREVESVQGIKVMTIHEFSCEDKESVYPVICSADIRGTEKVLQELGLVDYYIFVYNRDWICRANWTSVARETRG